MDRFSLGEIAIGQKFKVSTYLNGAKLEIVGELRNYYCTYKNKFPCEGYMLRGYFVLKSDGNKIVVLPENLRKKRPPKKEETGTWADGNNAWIPDSILETIPELVGEK